MQTDVEIRREMRLQRYLARAGVESRRRAEKLIVDGRVSVNGEAVTELGTKIDPAADEVAVDGEPVRWTGENTVIMLHKPAGFVTTMKPQFDQRGIADLVPIESYPGLTYIGRLDEDTTGLLLFSTDGDLAHALTHPSRHVPKTYLARLKSPRDEGAANRLRSGVELEDGDPCQPAEVSFADKSRKLVRMTIHEGKTNQVKRMFKAVGNRVVSLHREAFGPLRLGGLKVGEWRELSADEVESLRNAASPEGGE